MTHLRTTTAATLALWTIAQPLPAAPQAPAKPAAPKAAPRKPAAAKPAKPAPQAAKQPEVLNNDAILRMVAAGLDEETILTKIKTAPITDFALDADNLIKLKEGKTPQRVLRAMLAAKAPAAEPAPVKDPGPSTIAATEPAPAPEPPAPAIPAVPDQVLVRQGASLTPLSAKPQKIMFIKSEAGDMKTAVANILLSDVGLQLLTMGMSSQMKMWNPYMGDTIRKAAVAGKGILLNRENETKGFEIETLPGLTAETTLKEGKTEFYIPLTRYIPSADFDPAAVEPVLLRLQPRDADQ
ncbi:MAG TPA: hypothetical protein VER03_13080, partial [Bryobacteraceae bacterium]|nr:hypothetical protein [Bryobacteraceae bacterium]